MNLNVKLKSKGSYSDRVGLIVSNALIENKFSDTYSGVSEEMFNSDGHLVVQSRCWLAVEYLELEILF